MKMSVELSQKELEQAIRLYVVSKLELGDVDIRVQLHHVGPDRPSDSAYFSATALYENAVG